MASDQRGRRVSFQEKFSIICKSLLSLVFEEITVFIFPLMFSSEKTVLKCCAKICFNFLNSRANNLYSSSVVTGHQPATKHHTAGHSYPTLRKTREVTEQKRENSEIKIKKF